MNIVKIETIPVSVPRLKPFTISTGSTASSNRLITKVYTDEGLVGLGEAAPAPIYSPESLGSVKLVVDRYVGPAVIGEDIFDVEKILEKMDRAIVGNHIAKASIEIALWDLMGKSLGIPTYKLLGGSYRSRVSVAWVLSIARPSEMATEAQEYVGRGFRTLKLKIGTDPKQDIERVAAVRQAVGTEISIRLDANEGYSTNTAIRALKRMEDYDIELIEQPVARWNLRGLSKVRRVLHTPIMADESVLSPMDAMKIIEEQAADIINIKIMKVGGLSQSKRIAAIAESAGIACLVGSMIELGIGTSASVHFACSTKNIPYASELVGTSFIRDDVVQPPYVPEDGYLELLKKPGLGVELDNDKIKMYANHDF